MLVDWLAREHSIRCDAFAAGSVTGAGLIAGKEVVLAKPLTYMNLSGRAVAGLASSLAILPDSMLVVFDDCDLPVGTLRIRKRGGGGGHRGFESVISSLGTVDIPRLRLGVGRDPDGGGTTDHVLVPFARAEEQVVARMLERAAAAVEDILAKGIDHAMNFFNSDNDASGFNSEDDVPDFNSDNDASD